MPSQEPFQSEEGFPTTWNRAMHSLYLSKVGSTPMLTPEAIFQARLWFWVDTGWLELGPLG